MPPKKNGKNAQAEAEKKARAKKAQKSAEDKTFGLKNKNKSKKVQEQVSQLKGSVAANQRQAAMEKQKAAERKAAEEAKKEAFKLMANSIPAQKIPFGVDPKSILCEFFKAGACSRGKNCKFSHDLNVGRKTAKKDLYTDTRKDDDKEKDTIDTWDEEKLRAVIDSKHGNPKTTTDIVCKHFIEAVENAKYGWFWICPNGGDDCKYRHSLPPGFVLKTKEEKRLEKLANDAKPKFTLEEFIETERGKLPKKNLTPITAQSFAKWKAQHKQDKLNEKIKLKAKSQLSGKEIVMKRFEDKFYTEEEILNDKGTEWDMSEFRKELDDIDENVKDYGDGETAFAESQLAPSEPSAEIEKKEESSHEQTGEQPETQKNEEVPGIERTVENSVEPKPIEA